MNKISLKVWLRKKKDSELKYPFQKSSFKERIVQRLSNSFPDSLNAQCFITKSWSSFLMQKLNFCMMFFKGIYYSRCRLAQKSGRNKKKQQTIFNKFNVRRHVKLNIKSNVIHHYRCFNRTRGIINSKLWKISSISLIQLYSFHQGFVFLQRTNKNWFWKNIIPAFLHWLVWNYFCLSSARDKL